MEKALHSPISNRSKVCFLTIIIIEYVGGASARLLSPWPNIKCRLSHLEQAIKNNVEVEKR